MVLALVNAEQCSTSTVPGDKVLPPSSIGISSNPALSLFVFPQVLAASYIITKLEKLPRLKGLIAAWKKLCSAYIQLAFMDVSGHKHSFVCFARPLVHLRC